ncbi:MAG: Ldh family oxidoreductase [Bryobacteraceae bacterium]
MAGYPGIEKEQRVAFDRLKDLVARIFERCGMSPDDADLLADTLAFADLRGVHSHGVLRVPDYVRKLTAEGVDPQGRPQIARDGGSVLVIDGGNSMGQIGSVFAMRLAIERARSSGISAAAVRGSNHCGALAYYALMAVPEDMIGIVTTNALPTMAPWGGIDKIVGINPIAIAIPCGEEHPLVIDLAFSGSSHGKIRVYDQKGLPIPEGWATDKDGHPTTDAAAAIEGLLLPIGGPKGSGLAIMMGVLSSLLSGAAYGPELGDMVHGPKPGLDGHFFLALKVAAFEDVTVFKSRADGVIRQIRSGRTAPGVDRIYAPGGLEAETEARYRAEGIPLNDITIAGIFGAARQVGIEPSFE